MASVELRETHSGIVVLCGDRAYKTKKPVTTDFLDFSTPALRERACARELELNRRLAPDVYLGVAHLDDPAGGPAEPVLVMRRMPEDRRLSTILADPAASRNELSALVKTLAKFHADARRGPDVDREGAPPRLRARWLSLLTPLRALPADVVDPDRIARIEELALRYVDGRNLLLVNRIDTGRIVDGHGDLLAEDIFDMPDGFQVLDCLDFDDLLRYVDVVDDIAFLAMDLEFRGHDDLARLFVADYLAATDDRAPASLVDHYIAYRALVRAKVEAIRLAQGVPAARPRVHRHLDIAVRHLERAAVRLALVGGLPGTGKSTLATGLGAATGATVISSDAMRKQLRYAGAITGDTGRYDEGAYSPQAKALVYTEMLARARIHLAYGSSVILDASWTDPVERDRAAALAGELGAELLPYQCVCPTTEAAQRIRSRHGGDSDATPAIAAAMAAATAAWPEQITVDTAASPDDAVTAALNTWRG